MGIEIIYSQEAALVIFPSAFLCGLPSFNRFKTLTFFADLRIQLAMSPRQRFTRRSYL